MITLRLEHSSECFSDFLTFLVIAVAVLNLIFFFFFMFWFEVAIYLEKLEIALMLWLGPVCRWEYWSQLENLCDRCSRLKLSKVLKLLLQILFFPQAEVSGVCISLRARVPTRKVIFATSLSCFFRSADLSSSSLLSNKEIWFENNKLVQIGEEGNQTKIIWNISV